jgi:hypothetical protein
MNQNHLLIELVEVSLAASGDSDTINLQMPDEGFYVIAFDPRMYDANGAIVESVEARNQVVVTIKDKNTGGVVYCEAVDIFSLQKMHANPLWKGMYFPNGKQVQFTIQRTSTGTGFSGTLSVALHLIGYRGPFPTVNA